MIIEQSPDEIAAKLALMSDELGHSVLDIRERAIASLNFKLSNDLLTFKDVGSHSGVLRALLLATNLVRSRARQMAVISL